MTRPPQEDPEQLDADIEAMEELGRDLDETAPDVLVVVGLDHVETFFPGPVPPFAVVTGKSATSEYAGYEYEIPIHEGLALGILNGLMERGIDITYTHEALLGHAFATPFRYIHKGRQIPVVPIFVNAYLPPLPTTHRCLEVGKAIAEVVADRPEKVAILASGGMSHYPGTWKYFNPEYEFDHWAIQELEEGRPESLLALSGEQLDEVGNTELLTWFVAMGAAGVERGELLTYQPTTHHGHAVMRFIPDKGGRGQAHRDMPAYGGFEFKGQGYEFYSYPTLETYPLNRALARLRVEKELRDRWVRDMDGVSTELGFTPEQAAAMKTLKTDNVVALGGHGILTLLTMLAIQHSAKEAGVVINAVV
jgi:aromatic ring-opening dioxygenase catalytic subunit (LigB family)